MGYLGWILLGVVAGVASTVVAILITQTDIDKALDEMLFRGGMLNLKLLGAKTE